MRRGEVVEVDWPYSDISHVRILSLIREQTQVIRWGRPHDH